MSSCEQLAASSLRVVDVSRREPGAGLGFHLTRTKWDPYPWISSVDACSPAAAAGLVPGDCLLEVNDEDVVGRRVSEIAEVVADADAVRLLVWNADADVRDDEALCSGPMPKNFQRLSSCVSSILACLECPICLETIPPPAYQCDNGHLICIRCRAKSERCPVCRTRLTKSRCLLADQISNTLSSAFGVKEGPKEFRKIFGTQRTNIPVIKVTESKLGKSSSMVDLAKSEGDHLKAKSLSTNEIFCSGSPVLSRACSAQRLFVGSNESLHTDFFCPYDGNCGGVLKKSDFLEHFKSRHSGPLVQYLSGDVTVPLAELINARKNFSCSVQVEGIVFYLNSCRIPDSNQKNWSVLIWPFIQAERSKAVQYSCRIDIIDEDDKDRIFLSFRTPIYSLAEFSRNDIIRAKRGVLFTAEAIIAFQGLCANLSFNITIRKCI